MNDSFTKFDFDIDLLKTLKASWNLGHVYSPEKAYVFCVDFRALSVDPFVKQEIIEAIIKNDGNLYNSSNILTDRLVTCM